MHFISHAIITFFSGTPATPEFAHNRMLSTVVTGSSTVRQKNETFFIWMLEANSCVNMSDIMHLHYLHIQYINRKKIVFSVNFFLFVKVSDVYVINLLGMLNFRINFN